MRSGPDPGALAPWQFLDACSARDGGMRAEGLLADGIDPASVGSKGESLLDMAVRHRREEIARLLLLLGADPWRLPLLFDDRGALVRMPPFEAALARGMVDLCEDCLDDADPQWAFRREALWSRHLSWKTAAGARFWREGSTWMHLAVVSGNSRCAGLLRRRGFRSEPDAHGVDPLAASALTRQPFPVALEAYLAGGDPDAVDPIGRKIVSMVYPELLSAAAGLERADIEDGLPPASEIRSSGRGRL